MMGTSILKNRYSSAAVLAVALVMPFAGLAQEDAAEIEIKPRPAEVMPEAANSLLMDIKRVNGVLMAVGDRGNIVVSNNGKDWAQVPSPVRAPLTSMTFVDDKNGWIVGHDAVILRTSDGGKSWALQHFAPELEQPFLDVIFADTEKGFALGAYGMMYGTTDGGLTWEEVDAPAIRDEELHFNGVEKLGDGSYLMVGESGMMGISTDGGDTWQRLESPYEATLFGAIPVGEKGALVYGMRGNIFLSDDVSAGIDSWRQVDTGSVASMFGGAQLEDGSFALVGINGNVFKVSADGSSVQRMTTSGAKSLSNAVYTDGVLVIAGESGVSVEKIR